MKIAITGCGWVTPKAAGRTEDVLLAYSRSPQSARRNYEPIPQSIIDLYPNLPAEAAREAPVRIAAIALEFACAQAGLSVESHRKGLFLGCGLAGIRGMIDFANDVREQSARFVSPIRFPQTVGNYICGALARGYDFRGPASTIACGSASSLEAIREAYAILASNQADVVLAGGCETLSKELVDGLDEPGICFADGACFVVLEREDRALARGVTVLARVHVAIPPGQSLKLTAAESISTAGYREPQAICIEEWTGRTLGADGAAALATAIAGMRGAPVPRHGTDANSKPTAMVTVRARGLNGNAHELLVTL